MDEAVCRFRCAPQKNIEVGFVCLLLFLHIQSERLCLSGDEFGPFICIAFTDMFGHMSLTFFYRVFCSVGFFSIANFPIASFSTYCWICQVFFLSFFFSPVIWKLFILFLSSEWPH